MLNCSEKLFPIQGVKTCVGVFPMVAPGGMLMERAEENKSQRHL